MEVGTGHRLSREADENVMAQIWRLILSVEEMVVYSHAHRESESDVMTVVKSL